MRDFPWSRIVACMLVLGGIASSILVVTTMLGQVAAHQLQNADGSFYAGAAVIGLVMIGCGLIVLAISADIS